MISLDTRILLNSNLTNELGTVDAEMQGNPAYISGVNGQALRFDGVDDALLVYPQSPDSFEVPGGFTNTGLTYDSKKGTFWIGDFTNSKLVEINRGGQATGQEILLGFQPQGVAFDSSDDTLWVADHYGGAVRHYDLSGLDQGDGFVVSGYRVNGVAYNPLSDEVLYVRAGLGSGGTNVVARHSARTGALLQTVTVAGATNMDGLEYDPVNNQLLVTEDNADELYRVSMAGTIIGSVGTLSSPEDVALVDNEIYYCLDAEFHDELEHGNRVFLAKEAGYARSFSLHLRVGTIDSTEAVTVIGNPINGRGLGLYVLTGGSDLRVFARDGSNSVFDDASADLSVFKHVTVVADPVAKELRLYVDELLSLIVDASNLNFTHLLGLGGYRYCVGASIDGDIPRFADIDVDGFYAGNTVWSAQEIANARNLVTASQLSVAGEAYAEGEGAANVLRSPAGLSSPWQIRSVKSICRAVSVE